METKTTPQILIVSGACCSPNLIRLDQTLEQALTQALKDLNLSIEVRKVSLSAVLHNGGDLTPKQHDQITTLFNGYGVKFTPALLINEDVRFAGKPPTAEQLKAILREAVVTN
ncbi:MAG: thioredoxin family protein [Bellilinea sp.]